MQAEAMNFFRECLISLPGHAYAKHYLGFLLSLSIESRSEGFRLIVEAINSSNNSDIFNNTIKLFDLLLDRNDLSMLESAIDTILPAKIPQSFREDIAKIYLRLDRPEKVLYLLTNFKTRESFKDSFYRSVAYKQLGMEIESKNYFSQALNVQCLHYLYDNSRSSSVPSVLILHTGELYDYNVIISSGMIFEIPYGSYDLSALIDAGDYRSARLFLVDRKFLGDIVHRLECFDVVINTVSDPEIAFKSLDMAADICDKINRPIINHPKYVLNTSRESVSNLAQSVPGILSPRTVQIDLSEKLDDEVMGKLIALFGDSQLLVRPLGSSTGKGLELLDDITDLMHFRDRYDDKMYNITEFIDFVSEDGLYRKYRVFFVEGEMFPEHCVASKCWNIHSSSRMGEMINDSVLQHEEETFLKAPSSVLSETNIQALKHLCEKIRLEYMGVDFGLTRDRQILLFEANSGMRVNNDYNNNFPYLSRYTQSISFKFKQMLLKKATNVNE